ncbi:MAG: nucleoside deaminase [Rickettsiales bacterium]
MNDYDGIAKKCVEIAKKSSSQTYGVGAIVHNGNDVIIEANNSVYQDGTIKDSSAHAEIQAIRKQEQLAKTDKSLDFTKTELTTSMCPCMMCTGALLRLARGNNNGNGYRQIRFVAPNETVNFPIQNELLPRELQKPAMSIAQFNEHSQNPELVEQASSAFYKSRDRIRTELIKDSRKWNSCIGYNGETLRELNSVNKHALSVTINQNILNDIVESEVRTIAEQSFLSTGERDAAILFDPEGKELFRSGSKTNESILATPIMNVITDYENWAFNAHKRGDIVPDFTDCTIVSLREPQLMEAGRLGFAAGKNKLRNNSLLYLTKDDRLGVESTGVINNLRQVSPNFGICNALHYCETKFLDNQPEKYFMTKNEGNAGNIPEKIKPQIGMEWGDTFPDVFGDESHFCDVVGKREISPQSGHIKNKKGRILGEEP